MKIRHPWLLKLAGFLAYLVLRLWLATLRMRVRSLVGGFSPYRLRTPDKYIFAFWHENLIGASYFVGPGLRILISQHADGEIIADTCRLARAGTIRGSTTRGGIEATRQLLRASGRDHLVVVPDGPRGPRRQVKPGLIWLAARTGLPIVPSGLGFGRCWRLRTWDRFVLPRPGSTATVVFLPPIHIPATVTADRLEAYRALVEEQMLHADVLAQHWAETGRWCGLAAPPSAGTQGTAGGRAPLVA